MHPGDLLFALALLGFALAAAVVLRGPSDADRAVAADLAFFAFVAAVVVAGTRQPGTSFMTVVLVAAMTACLSSFALARLIDRGEDR